MTDTSQTPPPDDPPMSRKEKTENRRYNERVKLISSLFHSLALAVFALGALRILLDPAAQPPTTITIVLAIVAAIACEGAAYYILGRMKAES